MITETLTESLAIVDKLDPASVGISTATTTGADLSKGKRITYIVSVGAMTAASTLTPTFESAAASNFATPHTLTGMTFTQVTQAAAGSNTIFTGEVRADQVQQQNDGDRYVRLKLVVAGAASILSVVGILGELHNEPATTTTGLGAAVLTQRVVCTS